MQEISDDQQQSEASCFSTGYFTITDDGEFVSARKLLKKEDAVKEFRKAKKAEGLSEEETAKALAAAALKNEQNTLCQIYTGTRSGIHPYPYALSDKIKYLLGPDSPSQESRTYYGLLKKWADFGAPECVKAVCRYVGKGTLLDDAEPYLLDGNGKSLLLDENKERFQIKKNGTFPTKAEKAFASDMVRFTVIRKDGEKVHTWNDPEVVESFIQYKQHLREIGECKSCSGYGYDPFSGKMDYLTENMDGSILARGTSAKIASCNNKDGKFDMNLVGMFRIPKDGGWPVPLGDVSSQKISRELVFLCQHHGVNIGDSSDPVIIICFREDGEPLARSFGTPDRNGCDFRDQMLASMRGRKSYENPYGKEHFGQLADDPIYIAQVAASQLGGKGTILFKDITMLSDSEMIDHLNAWCDTCRWPIAYRDRDGKWHYKEMSPSADMIANAVYIRTGSAAQKESSSDRLYKKRTAKMLYDCVYKGKKIPKDLIHTLMSSRARNAQVMFDPSVFYTACALIRKYYYDHKGGIDMRPGILPDSFPDDKTRYSYLWGAAAAAADDIESSVNLRKAKKAGVPNSRMTHIKQAWGNFMQNPGKAWTYIYKDLCSTCRESIRYLDRDVQDIFTELGVEGMAVHNLEPSVFIGYYNMQQALIKDRMDRKKESKSSETASAQDEDDLLTEEELEILNG